MAVGDFFFTPWVLLLITKECHDKFFIDFNFFDGKFSWNILITKVLSYRDIRASEMEYTTLTRWTWLNVKMSIYPIYHG